MENSRLARSGRGFTLIELLVVITIIGILVGILMPAVQSAREAGRRTDCMNNLKQMSTASQNHLASLGYLPGGGNCSDTPTFDTSGNPCVGRKQDSSWIYQILPYLGQTPLWQKIPTPGNPSQDNCALRAATPLSFIFCPSRASQDCHEPEGQPPGAALHVRLRGQRRDLSEPMSLWPVLLELRRGWTNDHQRHGVPL